MKQRWLRGERALLGLAALALGCPGEGPQGGSDWRITAEPDASVGALLSVWGTGPDELRAVGGQLVRVGEPGVGVVLRRDGEAWIDEAIPADTPLLNWIHGAGGVEWAVGNAGAAIRRQDGGAFIRDDAPVDAPLWGVWVLSAGEAWAVGGDALDPASTGVLVHFVGGAWSEVALPPLDRPARALFQAWASGASDVYAVGHLGVILHYDGSRWAQAPSDTTDDLISLWGRGPSEIVAVGGRSNGVMARLHGGAWTATTLARFPALSGIWMADDGTAILAGARGTIATLAADAAEPELVDTPPSLLVLHAVFGLAIGERVAVGGSLDTQPPYDGVIMESVR